MERNVGTVKRRSYDATGRREQARRTREAILDNAQRRFMADGYAATTIAAIASDAGVSVETVYKGFNGKSGLVRALYERGLAGQGSMPAYQRSDDMRAAEQDPRAIMREWGQLTAEVASFVTPIRLLMRAAATTDADMAALLEETNTERLERMRHHARFLHRRGFLRDGVSVAQAADVLWTCSSVELYDLLVLQRGWPLRRFATFLADLMIAELLP